MISRKPKTSTPSKDWIWKKKSHLIDQFRLFIYLKILYSICGRNPLISHCRWGKYIHTTVKEREKASFLKRSEVNILKKTYRKKSEIWPRRTLGRNWEHWADIWDIGQILRTLSRHMGHWAEIGDIGQTLGRHWSDIGQTLASSLFLIKQHFTILSCKIRLFRFLIQDETFLFSYPR